MIRIGQPFVYDDGKHAFLKAKLKVVFGGYSTDSILGTDS